MATFTGGEGIPSIHCTYGRRVESVFFCLSVLEFIALKRLPEGGRRLRREVQL